MRTVLSHIFVVLNASLLSMQTLTRQFKSDELKFVNFFFISFENLLELKELDRVDQYLTSQNRALQQ